MYKMKIAIIGAGIYGTTIAIKLADRGLDIDVIEKGSDILQAASGINQYRLHRGYHYPRSKETGYSSRQANPVFQDEYGEAIISKHNHYYCVPKEASRVSGENFLKFCQENQLEHQEAILEHLRSDLFDMVLKVDESLVDPEKLKKIIKKKIAERKINLILQKSATPKDILNYDLVINCTYANLNAILESYPESKRKYQFELCEKPVLRLPEKFRGISAVVMDGPFFCIDPYAETDLHVMGNVIHAIHSTNVGFLPEIPEKFEALLNKGIVKNPSITNFPKFIESASYFMPELKKAEHIGSMYTIRTVLPNVDHTDERPTIVSKVGDKIINVFSGKLNNCVQAADAVLEIIKKEHPTATE